MRAVSTSNYKIHNDKADTTHKKKQNPEYQIKMKRDVYEHITAALFNVILMYNSRHLVVSLKWKILKRREHMNTTCYTNVFLGNISMVCVQVIPRVKD